MEEFTLSSQELSRVSNILQATWGGGGGGQSPEDDRPVDAFPDAGKIRPALLIL
jgi:hypothetical protein